MQAKQENKSLKINNDDGANENSADLDTKLDTFMAYCTIFQNVIISPKFLMASGISISCGLIVEGLLCFTLCSVNMRSYVLSFYYIIFGLFTTAIEFKFHLVMDYCGGLFTAVGKGLWYLFLASLSFGSEWWAILVAVLLICNGMLNSYVGCVPNVGKTDEGRKYDCDKDTDSESIDADNVKFLTEVRFRHSLEWQRD